MCLISFLTPGQTRTSVQVWGEFRSDWKLNALAISDAVKRLNDEGQQRRALGSGASHSSAALARPCTSRNRCVAANWRQLEACLVPQPINAIRPSLKPGCAFVVFSLRPSPPLFRLHHQRSPVYASCALFLTSPVLPQSFILSGRCPSLFDARSCLSLTPFPQSAPSTFNNCGFTTLRLPEAYTVPRSPLTRLSASFSLKSMSTQSGYASSMK